MGLVTITADQLLNGVASRLIYEGSICDSWPCWNEGICEANGTRHYVCHCASIFTGDHCQFKISDLCSTNNCSLGSNCLVDGRLLKCPGEVINDFVSSCLSVPCLNNGQCLEGISGHRCECAQPFHGPFCQFEKGSWSYHWTVIELVLFMLVILLIICAVSMICCSFSNSIGVYVTVPNKRYSTWEEGDLSGDDDEDDVIALGDLKKATLRTSRTRETMLDPEVGCSNPCLDTSAVML